MQVIYVTRQLAPQESTRKKNHGRPSGTGHRQSHLREIGSFALGSVSTIRAVPLRQRHSLVDSEWRELTMMIHGASSEAVWKGSPETAPDGLQVIIVSHEVGGGSA